MPRKRHHPEEIVAKLRQIDVPPPSILFQCADSLKFLRVKRPLGAQNHVPSSCLGSQ